MAEDVVIVGGARTPFCEWVGVSEAMENKVDY